MAIIDKPSDHFNTIIWTGNGADNRTISGVGFQPDWTWIKERSATSSHHLQDSVRGATKALISNSTDPENISSTRLKSWNSDGFVIGTSGAVNANSDTYASWNWKAGTSFTNDASATGIGTIDSTGSTNTTSGFSIVKWTSTGSTGTVAHNLGVTPKFIVVKRLEDSGYDWVVYHVNDTAGLYLNSVGVNNDSSSATIFDRSPTSTVFNITADGRIGGNTTGKNYIAYCFSEVPNYSKFGVWAGNGNADGPFIYTGFKPAYVFIKAITVDNDFLVQDNKRYPFNTDVSKILYPNSAKVEADTADTDILSNGFKLRNTTTSSNTSGRSYIYMAIAENPFVTSTDNGSIPTTAR